jgi:hypothetical protein
LRWHNKGQRPTSFLTVNGRVTIIRAVFWNPQRGSVSPIDQWRGLGRMRYSPGVRELCCRESARSSFRRVSEDLARVGQLAISHESLRGIVETEGRQALLQQRSGGLGPNWKAEDCISGPGARSCVITGADGVTVPLVTEAEKVKRRRRRPCRRKGQPPRPRIRRGSDQRYKEFKILTFYDPSHEHQYAVGTSDNHQVLGRLMRRERSKLGVGRTDLAYSVSDGADWIYRQYQVRLPMLKANVLDYYHVRDHVIKAGYVLFGEGSAQAQAWRETICGGLLEHGPVETLASLASQRKTLRAQGKRQALTGLVGYIGRRVEMLDYPRFMQCEYEIGSGPTEAFCKTLTSRLKGPGMRWDTPHAEAIMALAWSSRLRQVYWQVQRKTPA